MSKSLTVAQVRRASRTARHDSPMGVITVYLPNVGFRVWDQVTFQLRGLPGLAHPLPC